MENLKKIGTGVAVGSLLTLAVTSGVPNEPIPVITDEAPIGITSETQTGYIYDYVTDPAGQIGWRAINVFVEDEEGNLLLSRQFLLRPDTVASYISTDIDGNDYIVPEQSSQIDIINLFDNDLEALEIFVEDMVENPDTAYTTLLSQLEE